MNMMNTNNYSVNIMMFGGRRCGKTSVLAAMKECFDKKNGGSDLTITADDNETMLTLRKKRNEIRNYFANRGNAKRFKPDDNPTKGKQEYKMRISLKSKSNNNLVLNFLDFPGEDLDNASTLDELDKDMEKSEIIIIAVDTPFLMENCITNDPEEVGQYNEGRNYCDQLSDMVKQHFDLNKSRKMIIFVPLKCEKYIPNQQSTINSKICNAYSSLINHVTANEYANSCQVVITPIQTFGKARFARFDTDGAGNIKLDENGLPSDPIYIFDDDAKNEPEPVNCEIPVEMILLYLFDTARQAKQKEINNLKGFEKIAFRFGKTFLGWPGADDFMGQEDYLREQLRKASRNYFIVADPLRMESSINPTLTIEEIKKLLNC